MNDEVLLYIGTELKKARKVQKLSVEEIAERVKIRRIYLRAIEDGDSSKLKINTFTVGYIKIYAEFLGLDPTEYLTLIKDQEPTKMLPIASKDLITGKEFLPSRLTLIICAVLVILLYFIIEFNHYIG